MGDCMAWGTPLEVAIATNNALLVEAFLHTTNTYPPTVALNLHHLLPRLLDSERAYRDSLWSRPTVPPLGLLDLVHPHDPPLPLFIHGRAAPRALESNIDFVLGTGAAALSSALVLNISRAW